MSGTPSKVELVKEASRQLRGSLSEELRNSGSSFCEDSTHLLKFHGTYQQDHRDQRGGEGKSFIFMVRSRIPGGKITAAQLLGELDLCERYGNGTLRITDRQGFQLHGVLKSNLRDAIRGINEVKLSTIAACGDVSRNVMCCPAPYRNSAAYAQMQEMADQLAAHLKPRTTAYYDVWLRDEGTEGESQKVAEFVPVEEPIYGKTYLPRKFKVAIALPEDNCVDVYCQDLGFLAVVEKGNIIGYNVIVGGGMGMTPANKKTFPAVGVRMAFARPEQMLAVAEGVVKVHRDYGNRSDRKLARLKYIVAEHGIAWVKERVEEYCGQKLADSHPADVTGVDDHIGWHEQGDGKLFLGINVENGRIKDEGELRLKTGLRAIFGKHGFNARLTPLQGVILCDVDPKLRPEIDRLLKEHGIKNKDEISLLRRYSIACPAYPTCGLAVTESERVMPGVIDQIETELARLSLTAEKIAVHMTGCPNGCARPYTPDIGLVGKAKGKYTVYLGGNAEGTRLGFLWQDLVPEEEIAGRLSPVFAKYRSERKSGESFGDFCHRAGKGALGGT